MSVHTESEAWARFHRALGLPRPALLPPSAYPRDYRETKGLAGLDLIRRAQAGDHGLLGAIVRVNEPFVRKVVRPYWQTNPWNRNEITQVGRVGLFYALQEKFDPEMGNELTTYAKAWIEHYAQRWLRDHGRTIRIPVGSYDKALAAVKDGATSEEDVAKVAGKHAAAAFRQHAGTVSLDREHDTGDGVVRLIDVIADEQAVDGVSSVEEQESKSEVHAALTALSPMDRHVIQARWLGVGRLAEETLKSIGDRLHLSRERIRQIEVRAMRRFRLVIEKRRRGDAIRPPRPPRVGSADEAMMVKVSPKRAKATAGRVGRAKGASRPGRGAAAPH